MFIYVCESMALDFDVYEVFSSAWYTERIF